MWRRVGVTYDLRDGTGRPILSSAHLALPRLRDSPLLPTVPCARCCRAAPWIDSTVATQGAVRASISASRDTPGLPPSKHIERARLAYSALGNGLTAGGLAFHVNLVVVLLQLRLGLERHVAGDAPVLAALRLLPGHRNYLVLAS